MRTYFNWLILVAVVLACGCASMPTQPPPPLPTYRIHAPDVIMVRVRPDPSITQRTQVRPDGYVHLDLI